MRNFFHQGGYVGISIEVLTEDGLTMVPWDKMGELEYCCSGVGVVRRGPYCMWVLMPGILVDGKLEVSLCEKSHWFPFKQIPLWYRKGQRNILCSGTLSDGSFKYMCYGCVKSQL